MPDVPFPTPLAEGLVPREQKGDDMISEGSGAHDRRLDVRVSAAAVHAIIVDIEEDGIMVPGALLPHDISTAGVRGKWERPLPEGSFALHLEVADGVECLARAAWQRLLPSGGSIAGVGFIHISEDAQASLQAYVDALQAPPRRRSPRYSDVLPVELIDGDSSLTAIACDVSIEGLQITSDAALPDSDAVTLLLPLTWGVPLEVGARICWRRDTTHGQRLAGLEFTAMSQEAREALTAYLDELTS